MLKNLDNEHIQQMIESCPIGLLLLNNDGRVSMVNAALRTLLGEEHSKQLTNKRRDEVPENLRDLFSINSTVFLQVNDKQNGVWLKITSQDLENQAGSILYLDDVSEQQLLQDEIAELRSELNDIAMVDAETGMRNRKGLFYSLEPQISRSRRYERPLSVLILRLDCIDDFKQRFNTDSAKPLLLAVSYMLNEQIRWADQVGRLSETDFLLVLPETQLDDAQQVKENLSAHLTNIKVPEHEDSGFEISALFGIAEWRRGDDMGLLLGRAREMLNGDTRPQPATAG